MTGHAEAYGRLATLRERATMSRKILLVLVALAVLAPQTANASPTTMTVTQEANFVAQGTREDGSVVVTRRSLSVPRTGSAPSS
jgi:uncharacterized lipoprotein YajG